MTGPTQRRVALKCSSPRRTAVAIGVALVVWPMLSLANSDDDKEISAESAPRPADMPLSPLPEPPSLELQPPRPEALEAIDGILHRIIDPDPVLRERASRQLLETKPDWVSGLSRRIDRVADRADKTAAKKLLLDLKKEAREGLSRKDPTPDYLDVALRRAKPESQAWKDLVQILAVSRMLRNIETSESIRELIRIYVRFGDFLRIDTQRQLDEIGDRALGALIEAQRHQAPKIASWAQKQLDLRGKAIAHEAVRTDDQAALADILVALGRTRDPDSARILLSFAGSERAQIQLAARQGLALLGDVGAWQLRDAYLDTTGRKPPRDWTWKRTARELFTEYDRLRLKQVFSLFDASKKHAEAGRLKEMKLGYDEVLARSPLFEKRDELGPGYIQFAEDALDHLGDAPPVDASAEEQAIYDASLAEALDAARRAVRVLDDQEARNKATALRSGLLALTEKRRGVVDRTLQERAQDVGGIGLSSSADGAQSAGRFGTLERYLVALLVTALSLGGAGWILWTSRRPKS